MNFILNYNNINITDLIPLITGEGLPYKFNNKKACVSMFEYNCLTCKYKDGTIHIYKKPNGLELFKKDIEHEDNNFEWINENKEVQLSLLNLMPRFHGKLLKTFKRDLYCALKCNDSDSLLVIISDDNVKKIKLLIELLKRKNLSSYDLIKYYYSQQNTIEI